MNLNENVQLVEKLNGGARERGQGQNVRPQKKSENWITCISADSRHKFDKVRPLFGAVRNRYLQQPLKEKFSVD
jgi:hypothetical protein